MLTVSKGQLAHFGAMRRGSFVDRLWRHLAEAYPSWSVALSEPDARAWVAQAVEFGEQSGVRSAQALATLVELLVEFGDGFANSPDAGWARDLLAHPNLPDRLKVTLLSERMRARSAGRRVVERDAVAQESALRADLDSQPA
jgi:hypothetical protein